MSYIPHEEIPLDTIRCNDILLLVGLGAGTEVLKFFLKYASQYRSNVEIQLRKELFALRKETVSKRQLGPSAFVETSKLERLILSKEKEVADFETSRTNKETKTKKLLQRIGWITNIFVFLYYYGLPLLSIHGMKLVQMDSQYQSNVLVDDTLQLESSKAAAFFTTVFFPLSYMGMKLSTIGIDSSIKASSIGALVIYWSSKSFFGNLLACLQALTIT